MQPHWNAVNIRCHLEVGVEAIVLFSLKRCWARDNTSDVNKIALSPLLAEGRTGSSSSRSRWWYETVMVRGGTMGEFFVLLVTLPVTMANSFSGSPGVVRGDVTASAALEWTLQSEPGSDDGVSFTSSGVDVFRYIPYTGVIPPPILEGPDGNEQNISVSFDSRFTIYNTTTRGVGFRVAGLRPEDAGTYTCRYASLGAPIAMDAVLFVYDIPDIPVIAASPQIFVEGVTNVSLECRTFSTSHPFAHRPAMLYTWSRNGVDIDRAAPPERHAMLGDRGQTLEISPVHHTDTTYTCRASENGTQLTSEETKVTLDIRHEPYNLKINPEKPSAREKDSLEIKASADCNPACNYTWSIGDDVISQEPLLKFDKFHSHDADNYTVRAANIYGTADLSVEVTLDTNPESGDSFIVIVASAAAGGVVLIVIVIVVTAVLCVRRKGKLTSEYVNSEVFKEPGQPASDYVNSEVFREPGHPTSDYVNSEMYRGPTSAGHQPADASGHYESMDMATREPANPINRVYASLQQ